MRARKCLWLVVLAASVSAREHYSLPRALVLERSELVSNAHIRTPTSLIGQASTLGKLLRRSEVRDWHDESKVCKSQKMKELLEQLDSDFYHFSDSSWDKHLYKNYCGGEKQGGCAIVQIRGGHTFVRQAMAGWGVRLQSVLHQIYMVGERFGPLPDADFIVNVDDGADGPIVQHNIPVFIAGRQAGTHWGVLYPDHSFFSWPDTICPHPKGATESSHTFWYLYNEFVKEGQAMNKSPSRFLAKKDVLFWRGAPSDNNGFRGTIVEKMRGQPHIDMKLMRWTGTELNGKNTAKGDCVGLLQQCDNRYLAYLHGVGFSSGLKYAMLCGSVLFSPLLNGTGSTEQIEYWSRLLKPGVDYIETLSDFSDVPQKLEQIRALPDKGRSIALNAQKKALALLSEDSVGCYWLKLIESAAVYLPYLPFKPGLAVPIEDALVSPRGQLPVVPFLED